MGLSIADMDLAPVAKAAANQLLSVCPFVVFTSGRRSLVDQARAMAQNVMQNRQWIGATYIYAAQLQSWVDWHPEATTLAALQAGLYEILVEMGNDAGKVSRHLTGDAFDVQPLVDGEGKPTDDGLLVITAIQKLNGLDRFLTKEGGLCRWHCQFKEV